jgi:hypothetical protein
MGRSIRIIIGIVIVLGVALFLVTAKEKTMHKPSVTPPAVAP